MDWLRALTHLRDTRTAGVLATVTDVRGHAPRDVGAKVVVGADATWGSVGGGNLEEVVVRRARELLVAGTTAPEQVVLDLSDRAAAEHGVQCCGGRVTVLLEPLPVRPAVVVFGTGHVGLELAWVLSRHDVELHLVDSRPDQLSEARLGPVLAGPADVHVHTEPVLPELTVAVLPRGVHALVLTHDHAEDLALVDALLRSERPESIGLIGSAAKWTRFRARLAELGHDESALARVRSPIGDPGRTGLVGKEPAVIALAVAVEVLSPASVTPTRS